MTAYRIIGPESKIEGTLEIGGSKSISNRILIIRALSNSQFKITKLSDSDDTKSLSECLSQKNKNKFDVHHAGTTYRFLSAYFAISKGVQFLTGSSRMLERPIKELVECLREIGADIRYAGKEGYPPLEIGAFKKQLKSHVKIRSDVSSQFISALCMIAPCLPDGLNIELQGEPVSQPYLNMTLKLMQEFGIDLKYSNQLISIRPQEYKGRDFMVESDWSSASYHFGLAAISDNACIRLKHFNNDSLQGDSELLSIMSSLGVNASIEENYLYLESVESCVDEFQYDFIDQPDLFQTIAVIAAAKNIKLKAKGLKTLKLKETDRVKALRNELSKIGSTLKESQQLPWEYELIPSLRFLDNRFDTYNDHRMAMSLSMLGLKQEVIINDPEVVTKSYSNFWEHLQSLGFMIEKLQ